MSDTLENSVSAGLGSDFRAAAVGAMMPLGLGLAGLVGYIWVDVFGVILAIGGGIWWAVWWRRKHGKFFPRDVQNGPFVLTSVLVAILLVVAIVIM
ncbi:hypothetical protein [Actinocrispum wychmicini]|uniref:Uncharacterized protein n=1 Tax=Actinocrispum wychmicini TaxID=1213861 RepID=A0A4R2ITX1_9PSEU|nr:hypothetical protein [Actinocrispum wychmicini]TCO48042.1 hypothetical protein EV192_11695 [Actinocrispum wychmicini]